MSEFVTPMWRIGTSSINACAANLTATGHYAGAVYAPTPGKTVSKVIAYCTVATGSPVVDVRLESLNVGGYFPSGNLIATDANLSGQSVAAATWYSWSLTAPYTVPTGSATLLAVVIRYTSGTTINFNLRNAIQGPGVPRTVQNQGIDVAHTAVPIIGIEYSDGTMASPFAGVIAAPTATSYNSTSNPDEYGNSFTAPCDCVAPGLIDFSRFGAAGASIRYRIMDSDLNVLTTDAELTVNAYYATATSGAENRFLYFSSPVSLIGGKTYYITRAALNSTANGVYSQTLVFPSAALKAPLYSDMALCTRQNDAGAFTVDNAKVEMLVPILSTAYGLMRLCNNGGFCG